MSEKRYDLYIGGEWVKANRYMTVRLPYDGSVVGEVPSANRSEMERAIAAASRARRDAARMPAHKRSAILYKACQLMEGRKEDWGRAVSIESGKPIREGRIEAARAVQTLLFSAEEAKRIEGEILPLDAHPNGEGRFGFTLRPPRGVIAAITPFNFPLNLACHKVGPALASGNTVVLKPASVTPITAYMLAELFSEAGLPPGFLNVISGGGGEIGDALVSHPDVHMVTFTGSVEVGKRIHDKAGIKMVTLELGSNSAAIVDTEADLDLALERCRAGGYAHSGQVCISLQRLYAQNEVARDFTDRFVEAVRSLRIGHPLEDQTEVSSLIREADAQRVESWIQEAVAGGATLAVGGRRCRATTVEPAVLLGTKPDMRVVRDEIFGPVVAVDDYQTLDQAIEKVNDSRYGLQAGVFTRNLSKALHAAQRLEVGGVMINDVPTFRVDQMPYGGVKESGLGREGPKYAVQEMTDIRMVVIRA
ncbi:MAG: aldehyde dehydrogenase family protein [Planctomycetes bacterium]|nr:aldehyde dehydrogenase family protein [Planctomycetota bacterium]